MTRLEYIAHHGTPEQIIEEVSVAFADLNTQIMKLEIALRDIAKGCYDAEGCAAIARRALENS